MLACFLVKLEIEKKWLLGGGTAAVAVAALFLVAWIVKGIDIPLVGEGGSAPAQAQVQGHSDLGDESMPGLDLQHCVDIWNSSTDNAGPQSSMSALAASYVSVTFSDLYPGKCLVTGANPELNLSAQFLESDAGPYAYDQMGSGAATSLPSSVTAWNASSDGEGYLTLRPS